jgi:molybdopterin converting factor subunit 1
VRVKVRLFARLRDIAGTGELEQDLPDGATIGDAWAALIAMAPGLAPYASNLSCARNEDYARTTTVLRDGDEVAFLPPVSGGEDSLAIDTSVPCPTSSTSSAPSKSATTT